MGAGEQGDKPPFSSDNYRIEGAFLSQKQLPSNQPLKFNKANVADL